MAKFDDALSKLGKVFHYEGNPPSTEEQYNSMVFKSFDGEKPTWSEIKTEMDNLIDRDTLKANAKAKLIAGEPLTEEEADTIVL